MSARWHACVATGPTPPLFDVHSLYTHDRIAEHRADKTVEAQAAVIAVGMNATFISQRPAQSSCAH
jgi:hypothetical protein